MRELPIESEGIRTDNAPMNNTQNTPPAEPVRFYVKSSMSDRVWTFTVGVSDDNEARIYYAEVNRVPYSSVFCSETM